MITDFGSLINDHVFICTVKRMLLTLPGRMAGGWEYRVADSRTVYKADHDAGEILRRRYHENYVFSSRKVKR